MGTLMTVLAVIAVIAVGIRLLMRLVAIPEIRLDDVPEGDRRIIQSEMLVDRLEFQRDIAEELNLDTATLSNMDADIAAARVAAQQARDEVALEADSVSPVTDPVADPVTQRPRLRPVTVAAVRSSRQERKQ